MIERPAFPILRITLKLTKGFVGEEIDCDYIVIIT